MTATTKEIAMTESIIITNHFDDLFSPMAEDHDVGCKCSDTPRHLIVEALERGERMKRGTKVTDLSVDELQAFLQESWDFINQLGDADEPNQETRNMSAGIYRLVRNLQKLLPSAIPPTISENALMRIAANQVTNGAQ